MPNPLTNASAFDVAAYILQKMGPMSAMKLQKLVYYTQAWSLVWDDRPAFSEKIEAWVGGPVVRELYQAHRGLFTIAQINGDAARLDADLKETVDAVVRFYGPREGHELSQLTHAEQPWQSARQGLSPDDRGERIITLESMQEYYRGLAALPI